MDAKTLDVEEKPFSHLSKFQKDQAAKFPSTVFGALQAGHAAGIHLTYMTIGLAIPMLTS